MDEYSKNNTLFNDAYMIASGGSGRKHHNILSAMADFDFKLLVEKIDLCKEPKESFELLQSIPFIGAFVAYEIWTSLTYFKWFNQKWNENDFVNLGPGALPAIHYIYGEKSKGKEYDYFEKLYSEQATILTINKLLNEKLSWNQIKPKSGIFFTEKLSRLTVENICCEFRKYIAHTTGKTRAKRRGFNPENPNDYLKDKKFENKETRIGSILKLLEG